MNENVLSVLPANPRYGKALGEVIRGLEQEKEEMLRISAEPLDAKSLAEITQLDGAPATPEEIKADYGYVLDVLKATQETLEKSRTEDGQQDAIGWMLRSSFHSMIIDGTPHPMYDLLMQAFDKWEEHYNHLLANESQAKQSHADKVRGSAANIFVQLQGFRYVCDASYCVLHEMVMARQMQQGIPVEDCAETVYGMAEATYRKEMEFSEEADLDLDDRYAIAAQAELLVRELFDPYVDSLGAVQPEMAYLISEAVSKQVLAGPRICHSSYGKTVASQWTAAEIPKPANDSKRGARVADAKSFSATYMPMNIPMPVNKSRKAKDASVVLRNVIYDPNYVKPAIIELKKIALGYPEMTEDMSSFMRAAHDVHSARQSSRGAS